MAKGHRRYCFEVYPESVVEDWKDKLNDKYLSWACSPVHDMDVLKNTGELKKAHIHCYMEFDGQKPLEHVLKICDEIQAPHYAIVCENKRKAIRYFIHLDNPDKYRYALEDCENYGVEGFEECFQDELNNVHIFTQIYRYIIDNNVYTLQTLISYASKHQPDWLAFMINKNASLIQAILTERKKCI